MSCLAGIVSASQLVIPTGNVSEFLPLSNSTALPSRRNDTGARHLLLAFGDTLLAGTKGTPGFLHCAGGYRGDTSETRPAHPDAGVGTTFNMFTSNSGLPLFGDLGSPSFGNNTSKTSLDQKYTSLSRKCQQALW
jgi:hypothetical protein